MTLQPTVDLGRFTRPIVDPFQKQTHFFVGFTGSAKSTGLEVIAEKLLDAGNTGFDAHGGEMHESAFWSTNMGCSLEEENPCNCTPFDSDEGRYPMTLLVPHDLVLTNKNGEESELPLQFYNNNQFSPWEFKKYVAQLKAHGMNPGILEYNPNDPPQKPQGSPKVPWIRIVKLPVSKMGSSKKGIWEYEENKELRRLFLHELKFARDEGQKRVVVFNIGFWNIEFQRMNTLSLLIRALEMAKNEIFYPLQIHDRPYSEWTDREKTYDKIFMLFRELGDVADNTIKTDLGGWSTFVKKALGWYIKKGRQLNCSLIGDMQRPDDVMGKIRDHADWFHCKKSPVKLLGEGFKEFLDYLDFHREELIYKTEAKFTGNYDEVNKRFPRVQDLTQSFGWAVSNDEVYRLTRYVMPKHHHWRPEDHWNRITGIYWKWMDTDDNTVEKEGDQGQVTPLVAKIPDNTMQQVAIILSMMNDEKLRKKAIDEYSLAVPKKSRATWVNFIYPIYSKWFDDKLIQSAKKRPTPNALKQKYNEYARQSATHD
ncbi:MAG: hypothetical protein OPY03_00065 [Nitrosopumilus sp.]|nr:hypothetical protein [Nitrosopumilus sp.]